MEDYSFYSDQEPLEHEKRRYRDLRNAIFAFSFTQGINFTATLAFLGIYQDNYDVEIYEYLTIQSIMLIPELFWPFFGFFTDIVSIFGYKHKAYLFIIYFIETIVCGLTVIVTIGNWPKNYVIGLNFVFVLMTNFKELILFSLSLVLKNQYQLMYRNVTFDSSVTSLAAHYGSKFFGRFIGFIVTFAILNEYRKLISVCLLCCDFSNKLCFFDIVL